jgi:hypothetical protein
LDSSFPLDTSRIDILDGHFPSPETPLKYPLRYPLYFYPTQTQSFKHVYLFPTETIPYALQIGIIVVFFLIADICFKLLVFLGAGCQSEEGVALTFVTFFMISGWKVDVYLMDLGRRVKERLGCPLTSTPHMLAKIKLKRALRLVKF